MKLDLPYENEKQEFKTSLSELNKGIISLASMLNKHKEGTIIFGVDNSGEIVGLKDHIGEESLKSITNKVIDLIKPSFIIELSLKNYEGKYVLYLKGKGNNRPYSYNGDYRIRVGSENRKIDPFLLKELFFSSDNASLESIESINQNLTFNKLKFLYLENGLTIDDNNFLDNMNLKVNGKFNMLANLLADNNDVSIKVVRFMGKDKSNMIYRNEYGYKCILFAMKDANDYVLSINETRVDVSSSLVRKEIKLFDTHAFEEAWSNAILHNKWIRNVPPAIYIYDDRIEIISTGGLPLDYSKEQFYMGISNPINVGLVKIMGQLNLVEQTGHGNLVIVSKYGKEAFDIENNYILVTIPFSFAPSFKSIDTANLSIKEINVLNIIKDNPLANIKQLATLSYFGTTRVSEIIASLKNKGKLRRIGGKKGGYWEVVK